MQRKLCFVGLMMMLLGTIVSAEPIVLKAVSDFEMESGIEGQAEAYIHKGKQALAINAAKYKDMFASAKTVFTGSSGYYDITLVALLETDGESSYKLTIDGHTIGKAKQNIETEEDYAPYEHVWKGVRVNTNNVIQVAFNSHTNGKIPEGDITAYSRGRWTQLILKPATLDKEIDIKNAVHFVEKDGLVVMEVESTQSDLGLWVLKTDNPGYTGKGHLEFTGNGKNGGSPKSPLVYKFSIKKGGDYQLHIRARKRLDGEPRDKCNDGYVRVMGDFVSGTAGAPLKILQSNNKLFGGPAEGWGWASKLDAHHKKHNPIYHFKAGQTYILVLSGRSIRWNVDRIVFRHVSVDGEELKKVEVAESPRK